jgi:AraC family transcriptional regulator
VADEVVLPPTPDQLIVLVTRGKAMIEFSAARWRRAAYVPGQIGLIVPGCSTRLRWRSTSDAVLTTLHVYLPGRLLERTAQELWGRSENSFSRPDALIIADPVLEHVLIGPAEAAETGAGDLYAESAAAFIAAHTLIRYGDAAPPPAPGREDARMRRAAEFMADNLHLPLSLADIARAADLSSFHFLRVFKAATGQTPHRYLNGLRLRSACRHLESGMLPVTEIANLCGFSSPAHLSAALRRQMGTSPTAYRREHQRIAGDAITGAVTAAAAIS